MDLIDFVVERKTEKRDVDLLFRREERGEVCARVGGGGKSGWWGEDEEEEAGWDGLGVAQERCRWRSSARRVDMRVSRM